MNRPTELVNVVGPICESADVLGHDRLLPVTREGDVLLIANAGAYGRAMSSHYNLRDAGAGALHLKRTRCVVQRLRRAASLALSAPDRLVWYLDHLVTRQFEGRRWTLPAQVYAAPLELYAGLPLSPADLEHELQRLQYRRAEQARAARAPTAERATACEVALRPARFADESRAGAAAERSPRRASALESAARCRRARGAGAAPRAAADRQHLPDPRRGSHRRRPRRRCRRCCRRRSRRSRTASSTRHHGVDPAGMLRALWVNVRAGQIEQGGSTLTQQLVRSYFLNSRQTLSRKLREAVMAMALDAHFTKADLMNAYINEIFLGQDGDRAIHGFGLASQFYFGKPLAELDLSEVALLVAIVRGPSYYDPRRHAERARARRDLVLKVMARAGHRQAPRRPVPRPPGRSGSRARPAGAYYPAYLDFVRRTLRRDYHEEDLTEAGLRIYTSLEPRAQDEAERALERELARLDKAAQAPAGAARGRGGGDRPAERRRDRDRRRARRRLRRLRPRARCAPLHGLAGEAVHLSHRARERPLQRRHGGAGRAGGREARRTASTGSRRTSPARCTARCRWCARSRSR